MNGKPHSFNGTDGVVGLRRWIEKIEQVFEICKCVKKDKVMFAASTFEGRALTWWNGNVQTLGLVNANRIPWTEFKSMMTTKYCPAAEIQRMEQDLWTLTLKGDDIEAYNNHFDELALMCPDLVPNEKKKIKSRASNSGRATRISESNKRKWEDHQRSNNNNNSNNNRNRNNNNQHQQQNKRHETAKAYAAALTEGKVYAGKLPKCNQCNLHHNGQCPLKCQRWQKMRHREIDCKVRLPDAGENYMQNATCYGCGEKGHLKNKCPKRTNQQNEGARAKAYVMGTKNPQQNPNMVTVCYEKIVRIPLPNGEILEIQGERPENDPRSLSCIKADEKKLDDIHIVCNFPEVFPDDLSGLPPLREIEFRIDLIPGAFPVVKSPYRLAHLEMLEL
ncbi:putative reverse transcriptase domain-containing protein [Tanacetum coccineum]